jgi:hypothetical protein
MVAVIQPRLLWDRILSSGDDSEGIEPEWEFGRGRGQKMKKQKTDNKARSQAS